MGASERRKAEREWKRAERGVWGEEIERSAGGHEYKLAGR